MVAPSQSANSRTQSRPVASDRQSANNRAGSKADVKLYLTNCKSFYSCIYCRTHLANHDELVSRLFNGTTGRAYLFNSVVNINCGATVQRQLNTGVHDVCDIHCASCNTVLGWKYERAFAESQKYKEGKYIIELFHVVRENRHLEFDKGAICMERRSLRSGSTSSNSSSSACSSSQSSSPNSTPTSSSPSSQQQSNRIYSLLERLGFASSTTGNNSNTNNNSNRLAWPSPARDENPDNGRPSESNQFDRPEYDNVDEEDLIFPIYEDIYSSSSLPGSLSSNQHNRMRRSLYLDSTPYDWKYLATSIDAADQEPARESSRTGTDGVTSNADDYDSDKADGDHEDEVSRGGEDDTQFKFEADRPEIELMPMASQGDGSDDDDDDHHDEAQRCSSLRVESDPMDGLAGGSSDPSEMAPAKSATNQSSSSQIEPQACSSSSIMMIVDSQADKSSANNASSGSSAAAVSHSVGNSSISLDEDEFFDCHTVWPLI